VAGVPVPRCLVGARIAKQSSGRSRRHGVKKVDHPRSLSQAPYNSTLVSTSATAIAAAAAATSSTSRRPRETDDARCQSAIITGFQRTAGVGVLRPPTMHLPASIISAWPAYNVIAANIKRDTRLCAVYHTKPNG